VFLCRHPASHVVSFGTHPESRNGMTGKEQLQDILGLSSGVALDLYHAMEVISLDECMAIEADKINTAGFGAFFGSLQIILGRFLVLQVARMFERPGVRYQVRSIPTAIEVLHKQTDQLVIEERPALIRRLSRLGASAPEMESRSDADLTRLIATFFEHRLSASHPEGKRNARILRDLKTARNKWVAHPEAVHLEDLPKPTYAEIDTLVDFAKTFVAAIGIGYLGSPYDDDEGNFVISSDANRSTVCLRRLLQEAAVLPGAVS